MVQNIIWTDASPYKVVCYYTNWAQYRNGAAKFFPEDVDGSLCSHIVYAFAKLEGPKLTPFEWNDVKDWGKGMYERMMDQKTAHPNLKVLLAVGGWNMGSAPFTAVVDTAATRKAFIDYAIQFLRLHKFDGLDMDWEYPANRGSPPGDKRKFSLLMEELKAAFAAEASSSGNERLLLTAAVAAGEKTALSAYEVSRVCAASDFINLMSYDLHGSWESTTGHNSPLYARTGVDPALNVDYAVKLWLKEGCPKNKLVMGMPTYGRSFRLSNPSQNGLGAPAKGAGTAGPQTREAGFLSYYEVCNKIKSGWTSTFNSVIQSPYAYQGDQWVGYDNVKSIGIKSQYIKDTGLAGGMIWALDLDDFKGLHCGQGKYPLLSKINEVLNNGQIPSTAAPASTTTSSILSSTSSQPSQSPSSTIKTSSQSPVTTTTKLSTTSKTISTTSTATLQKSTTTMDLTGKCPLGDGPNPDPADCTKFFMCVHGSTTSVPCPANLHFNAKGRFCDWPNQAGCKIGISEKQRIR